MKIQEVLEKNNIQEGPLDTIGTAVGKTVGGAAKAVGAVAGGVAGIGQQLKKGYQAGKATVGGITPNKIAKAVSGAGAVTKSAADNFKAGYNDPTGKSSGTADKTPQDPFEIIKSLNRAQKQKLYNLL